MRMPSLAALGLLSVLALSFGDNYFPKGILHDDPQVDAFAIKWYSEQLKALEEPSLYQRVSDKSAESYRFVWLRTFNHPVTIRLEVHAENDIQLVLKVADGAGGYKPGRVIENSVRKLASDEAARVLAEIRKNNFWDLQSHLTPEPSGKDGSQWIIEGVKSGKYHVADRWSPQDGSVHELGLLFLKLSGEKIPERDLY